MNPHFFEFLSTHGTVVVLAITLLAATGIVQWRKAHIAELELAFIVELLGQGLSAAEIAALLHANAALRTEWEELPEQRPSTAEIAPQQPAQAAPRRGLSDQFGDLSGGTKLVLVVAFTFIKIVMLFHIAMAIVLTR